MDVSQLPHKAARLLDYLRRFGAPCKIQSKLWTPARLEAAISRGPHKSAFEHVDFLTEEMSAMVAKGQWMVLPYSAVKHLPHLRISPLGVVPQHDRRPRTIVDYTYYGVNGESVPLAPAEAMQFGHALDRILQRIVAADPRHGPVYMSKVDIADGFYRLHLNPSDVPHLGVAFPPGPDGEPLVAFPLTLPMGWRESPPWFSAATETGADLANAALRSDADPEPHRLEVEAESTPSPVAAVSTTAIPLASTPVPATSLPPGPRPRGRASPRRKPLQYVDVYVDDYLGLSQGGPRRRRRTLRVLLSAIDAIFRPLSPDDPAPRQEPSSVKKLRKGDASWQTRKTMLGWILDTICETIELPPRRIQRLLDILAELPRSKTRITTKKWHQILGELRSMVLAVPGLRGLFSTMQEALRHEERRRIKITPTMHDFLDDIRWIVQDLRARPTRFREIVDTPPGAMGACDAAAAGMGGVHFLQDANDPKRILPILWRAPFPAHISRDVVSHRNPHGRITNSDLELAGTIAQHDVLVQEADCRERTIFTLTDNTPALAWQTKGSTTTTGVPAYLLRAQALHQRHHRYLPRLNHIPGLRNQMADDCSRLWHLSDTELLTHFHLTYPQSEPWRLCQLNPATYSSLISALHKQRCEPASLLATPTGKTALGTFGANIVGPLVKTQPCTTSPTQSPSSKSLPPEPAMGALPPVAGPSGLAPFLPRSVMWARRSPSWGPRILG